MTESNREREAAAAAGGRCRHGVAPNADGPAALPTARRACHSGAAHAAAQPAESSRQASHASRPGGLVCGRAQRASEGFLEMRLVMSMGRCASCGCAAPLYTCGERAGEGGG